MCEVSSKVKQKRILVVTLGGTIAMTHDASGAIVPSLSAQELVKAVPGLSELARISTCSPLQMPGASLTLEHLFEVSHLIERELKSDADGAVVVQGTDTIEETAFVLDCLLATDLPVVVTGAMRGAEAAGADGPANLRASAIVAASDIGGLGALVVLNDEVHAARFVRKGHTGLASSFVSEPSGPIGVVLEDRFRLLQRPDPLPRIAAPPAGRVPPVALLQVGMGDDGRLVSALRDLGYEGAVIAAMGAGHVPEELVAPLEELAEQMPVVLSTRVVAGPVFQRTYGFRGSETDLLARGLLAGGMLGPLKGRLLLQLLLAHGADQDKIQASFSALCSE